jgi:hypothetical protein
MTTNHPLGSVAALKRALEPGATIRIVNHIRPQANRLATVLPKTNTVDLVTTAEGAPRGSHLRWPKAADLRPSPDDQRTVHIDKDGVPFLTITVLESEVDLENKPVEETS